MNVSLTPHYEQLVKTCVDSGRYTNADEVVGEALRIWEQNHDSDAQLKAEAKQGYDDAISGRVTRVANEEELISLAMGFDH